MKKRAARLGLINWCITLLTAAYFLWQAIPKPVSNFYETAQLITVLVDVDDGYGSGFIQVRSDSEGNPHVFAWTARHVVHGNSHTAVKVFTRVGHRKVGSMTFPARVLAELEYADAALLLVDAPAELFPRLVMDASDESQLGEQLFTVGNPHGSRHDGAVSEGVLSQFGVDDYQWPVADQTTTAFNPGSSGGAVFNFRTKHIVGMAVGTGGNGINVFVPTRALVIACRSAGLSWALTGSECPAPTELYRLSVAPTTPLDNWLESIHSLFRQDKNLWQH